MGRVRPLSRVAVSVVLACGAAWTDSATSVEGVAGAFDGAWRAVEQLPPVVDEAELWVRPFQFRALALDRSALTDLLRQAPMESTIAGPRPPLVIALPMPDGGWARFAIEESPIMAPELAAKFPEIKTYIGRGIDDPAASLRCDWTPAGFHAQVLSPNGAVYIDPYLRGDVGLYVSYFKRDARPPASPFECLTPPGDLIGQAAAANAVAVASGDTLRTYRLACAATGEYTQFHGGTVAAGMAAIVTAINRVTGIYETELAIRMVLVANNDLIVYTDPATDPYTNSEGGTMLGQNQANLNAVIGSANYDIGHVFSTGGGGIAGLRVVCRANQKAQGVTGLSSPLGDAFYVDYVAHEMGHEFGANHPFNGTRGSCAGNRNASTAYEPGSGSTIMAYAGICGLDDLQPHSDPYFHSVSFDEIRSYVTASSGNNCPVITNTGNNAPTVGAGSNYTIPQGTPFTLTASGSDPDGDSPTFCWEQRDLGPAAVLSAPDDGLIPLLRSLNPTPSPSRTFPRLDHLLDNTPSTGEKLPTHDRTMDFRVTVRDHLAGGGGVASDDMQVFVVGSAGPFRVTFPDTSMTVSGGLDVTWNVAGTEQPPISASSVNILLSTDGGQTFLITLAGNTPNDGDEVVLLPDVFTMTARVKVEAAGNVFFDISNNNFTIANCAPLDAAQAEPAGVAESRYLSFVPGNAGMVTALRVKLADLPPPFTAFNGETRWAGPPQQFFEGSGSSGGYFVSALQCGPYFADWGALGLLHVYGTAVVPNAAYDIAAVQCDPAVESNFAPPLSVSTGRWGDIVAPFNPPSTTAQPDAVDVASMVNKFKQVPGSPTTAQCDLYPDMVDQIINALDITLMVDAFKGEPYPFAGPTPCPP